MGQPLGLGSVVIDANQLTVIALNPVAVIKSQQGHGVEMLSERRNRYPLEAFELQVVGQSPAPDAQHGGIELFYVDVWFCSQPSCQTEKKKST